MTLVAALFHAFVTGVMGLYFGVMIVDMGDDPARYGFGVVSGLLLIGALMSLICAIGIMPGSRLAWVCGVLACVFGIVAILPTIILLIFLLVPPTRAWVRARSG